MTITNRVSLKSVNGGNTPIADVPDAPTVGAVADLGSGTTATVAYTAAVTGGTATSYTATSTPSSITGTGSSSPITVTGLTDGVAYTFKVKGINSTATGPESAASSSLTLGPPPGFESIATFTPTGVNTVTFSSIPQTYKHLQIRMILCDAANSNSNLDLRVNGLTSSIYSQTYFYGSDSSVATGYTASATYTNIAGFFSPHGGASVLDLYDYSSTTNFKEGKTIAGRPGQATINRFRAATTAAITSITLFNDNNYNFQTGTVIALYGIKGLS